MFLFQKVVTILFSFDILLVFMILGFIKPINVQRRCVNLLLSSSPSRRSVQSKAQSSLKLRRPIHGIHWRPNSRVCLCTLEVSNKSSLIWSRMAFLPRYLHTHFMKIYRGILWKSVDYAVIDTLYVEIELWCGCKVAIQLCHASRVELYPPPSIAMAMLIAFNEVGKKTTTGTV